MSSNKNHITSVIFSNQYTTSAFMVCKKKKKNLIAIPWKGTQMEIFKKMDISKKGKLLLFFFL